MKPIEMSELECKMLWLTADAGLDKLWPTLDAEAKQAAINVVRRVYDAYRARAA